jgi:hypothetical protein
MKLWRATTWHFFNPVLELPAIRGWLEYIDDHFLVLLSAIALFATFLLWVNI